MAPVPRKKLTILALLSAAVSVSAAAPAFDQARIRADYRDGEFEKVISGLRGFLETGRDCSRSDSLFLAKHLAVVYAANPDTRELGRYHMFRLLRMEPDADLLDMFVGREVDLIFDRVRKEHALNLAERKKHAPAPTGETATGEDAAFQAAARAWKDPGIWIGGGAALAVVAFTLYFSGSKQGSETATYVVPAHVR